MSTRPRGCGVTHTPTQTANSIEHRATLASATIITMLPSSPHVRQVYLDSNGVVPTLRSLSPVDASNTLCIDSTTLDVQVGRDVAAEAEATGAGMVDAPVSGGE